MRDVSNQIIKCKIYIIYKRWRMLSEFFAPRSCAHSIPERKNAESIDLKLEHRARRANLNRALISCASRRFFKKIRFFGRLWQRLNSVCFFQASMHGVCC